MEVNTGSLLLSLPSLLSHSFSKPKPKPNQTKPNQTKTKPELMYLANDFVYAARAVGKLIISEICLPIDQKMIKPMTLGGRAGDLRNNFSIHEHLLIYSFAGGEKYIVHHILFKFSSDSTGLFGGSVLAAAKGLPFSLSFSSFPLFFSPFLSFFSLPLIFFFGHSLWT